MPNILGKDNDYYQMPNLLGINVYLYAKDHRMSRKEVDTKHQAVIKQVGAKIKELRLAKGFTYIKMAEEVGISRNGYNLLELGNDYFNISSLLLVLDYHKISIKEFIQELELTKMP